MQIAGPQQGVNFYPGIMELSQKSLPFYAVADDQVSTSEPVGVEVESRDPLYARKLERLSGSSRVEKNRFGVRFPDSGATIFRCQRGVTAGQV